MLGVVRNNFLLASSIIPPLTIRCTGMWQLELLSFKKQVVLLRPPIHQKILRMLRLRRQGLEADCIWLSGKLFPVFLMHFQLHLVTVH